VKGLALNQCSFGNATEVLTALTSSNLLHLHVQLSKFPDNDMSEADFMTLLGRRIASMPALESFGTFYNARKDPVGASDAFASLTQGVSACPHLKRFEVLVYLSSLSDGAQRLLSECVQTGSPLEEVEVTTPGIFNDWNEVDLSVLFDAVKAKYSTLRFRFLSQGQPALVVINRFEMIACLNGAGRNYLETDPGDKHKGIAVLEAVSDDLDGLHFHLRENPLLCQRHPASVEDEACGKRCLEGGPELQSPRKTRRPTP
jgi:hypothetical protein